MEICGWSSNAFISCIRLDGIRPPTRVPTGPDFPFVRREKPTPFPPEPPDANILCPLDTHVVPRWLQSFRHTMRWQAKGNGMECAFFDLSFYNLGCVDAQAAGSRLDFMHAAARVDLLFFRCPAPPRRLPVDAAPPGAPAPSRWCPWPTRVGCSPPSSPKRSKRRPRRLRSGCRCVRWRWRWPLVLRCFQSDMSIAVRPHAED